MKTMVGVGSARRAALLGFSVTGGAAGAETDGLDPPRAVRRALADAGLKATDVVAIVVSQRLCPTSERVAAFARRALGPHGGTIEARAVADHDVVVSGCEATAAAACVTVTVQHDEGRTLALCLGPLEPGQVDRRGRTDRRAGDQSIVK